MNTTIRVSLCALALALCAAGLSAQVPPATAPAGKVLVLSSERTMEGDIEAVADGYRVRRPSGEVTVPARSVLRLCASMEDAYLYVRSRANLNDPDERLRLADWCNVRGLKAQAVEEVAEAVRLRPNHAASQRLLAHLQQVAVSPARPETTTASEEPKDDGPTVDLTNDSLCVFNNKVQPMLMNACASCHANGKGGAFKLTRTSSAGPLGGKAQQQNLLAVLLQVNPRQPQVSPLLTKAVTAHGSLAQAPLKSRQAPAYQLLETWVKQTLATNPQLGVPADLPSSVLDTPAPAEEKPTTTSFGEMKVPQEPAAPVDPFDPNIFNRQMHPPK